jgi:5-bromo-4-chloroindolyl phosphate hydrolysis protein
MTAMPTPPKDRLRRRYAGTLLFVLPLPLLFKAIAGLWGGDLGQLLGNGVPYALFVAGAMLERRGLRIEAEYLARPSARIALPPLKALATAVVGLATGLAAYAGAGHDAIVAALFGIGAAAGTVLYYGLDPKRIRGPVGDFGIDGEEVARALKDAYAKVDRVAHARALIRSREFQDRLGRIIAETEGILREIEEDPRDLRRARKFLHVYLDGVVGVTQKFLRASEKGATEALDRNYRALLMEMEAVSIEQHEKLRQNDIMDLDVQIEVLSTRLKREGVI